MNQSQIDRACRDYEYRREREENDIPADDAGEGLIFSKGTLGREGTDTLAVSAYHERPAGRLIGQHKIRGVVPEVKE